MRCLCNWVPVVLIVWASVCCAHEWDSGIGVRTAGVQYALPYPTPRYNYNFAYPYRSPLGFHRHLTFDGVVIEHSNRYHGSWSMHRDVPLPWDKYYGPIGPAYRSYPTYGGYYGGSRYCPGGVCPW